ncbi:motility associated factor glycosyltransferase family protein, partial [Candidatus Parcubacteria bacterium]|nr:motility associated factor glycosyltransferase family protein [Candidatus Parcubacteria bacterium]
MNENFLEKNLKILSIYNKDLADKILSHTNLNANYELKEAKSGDYILYKDGNSVDDDIDPVWNALEKYNQLQDKSRKSIAVILGMGLGYILKEFSKRYKGIIVVFEPNLDFLKIVFELVDFTDELKKPNIRIANTYEDLEKAYNQLYFFEYNQNIINLNYYENCVDSEVFKYKEKFETLHGIYYSNYKNGFKKLPIWTKSMVNNIPDIVQNPDLHFLKNKFNGKTAVIISAGPSLDKNIENLKPYRDKIIVFCVGTALKTVLKHDIIPDFVTIIDYSSTTESQVKGIDLSETNLILDITAYSGLYKLKTKNTFNYYPDVVEPAKWLAEKFDIPIHGYRTMGTVSICSLFSARLLGCKQIILIGQDLAYTDGQCYSKESIYGNYKLQEEKIIITDEEDIKKTFNNNESIIQRHVLQLEKNLITIKGHNGKILKTRPDFFMFLKYFEEIAVKYGEEVKLINSTEGGAYIEGFEHISLNESLEKYTNEKFNFKEIINNEKLLSSKQIKKRNKKSVNALKEVIIDYNNIKNFINIIIKEILFSYLNEEVKNKFLEIEKNILIYSEIIKKKFLGF